VNRRRADRAPGERQRKLARALQLAGPTVAALLLLGAAAWGAWRFAFAGDRLRVREIRFHGLARLQAEQLLTVLPVRTGDPILLVEPSLVAATLEAQPWVDRATVRRELLSGTIDVEIREHRAAALVSLGGLYLVNERGKAFERATPGLGLDLPVITGVELDAYPTRAELEEALAGAVALSRGWTEQRLDARAPISELHLDPVFGTTVVTADGAQIRLGPGDPAPKLARLARLLPSLAADSRKPEVIHLDNRRHPDWVAVRFAGEVAGMGPTARPETAGVR
jgi:cell division protein FtsQ